jgi:aspartoacylase
MRIAIVGGTHGNEPVGIEVVKALKEQNLETIHEYKTFTGNPKAYELQKRFVDSDLNRAFGKKGKPIGYEKTRSLELKKEIENNFDFIIDLHTTTTNMGLTVLLNNTNKLTQQASCYLKSEYPELKLIEEDDLDEDCTHLGSLTPARITIEVGPVANNVVSGGLVIKTHQMVTTLLNWDFKKDFDYSKTEVFKTVDTLYYPKEEGWYIHPSIENQDFKPLKPGSPIFINIEGEERTYEGQKTLYPFFINEAAYLRNSMAMILAKKIN